MAERGKVDYDQIRLTARNGQGTQVQMFGGGSVSAGHVAVFNGNGDVVDGGAAGGAVTSVGLSMPAEFTVSGSPVTSSGVLAVAKASQAKNLIWASPAAGAGVPTFRALVAADIPAGVAGSVTSVGLSMPAEFTVSGSPVTGAGTLTAAKASQSPNLVYASPSGSSGAPTFRALVAADIPAGVGAVASVFGRTGAIVAVSGDYTAAQVTNAVSTAGSYADPPWITSLAWAKITGAPAAGSQTPWLQNVNAAGFTLSNVPTVSGNGNITLAAGGAGTLVLQTNAKTRLSIDSGGNLTIPANDGGNGSYVYASGNPFNLVASTDFYINAAGTVQAFSGASRTQRLLIDSAGHVTINAPDNTTSGALIVSGNVGIGTTSPLGRFESQGGRSYFTAVNEQYAVAARYSSAGGSVYFGATNSTANPDAVISNAGGAALVTFLNSGNVGIGTTAPAALLDTSASTASDTAGTALRQAFSFGASALYAWRNGGNNNYLAFDCYWSSWINSFCINRQNGAVGIGTGATAPTASLQVMNQVVIGNTTPGGASNNAWYLTLANDAAIKPNSTTWNVISDIRLKEAVRPFTEGLETIRRVRPIRYRYNGKCHLPTTTENVGLDAGAHKDILPDCIKTYEGELDGQKTDLFTFNSHVLFFMMINAVNELAERLERLEKPN